MPKYSLLRAVSWIISLLGWISIVLSVVLAVVALSKIKSQPPSTSDAVALVSAFSLAWGLMSAASLLVGGLFLIAFGLLANVFMDIAEHTSRIPDLADNSARTVSFFEHVSGIANRDQIETRVRTPL